MIFYCISKYNNYHIIMLSNSLIISYFRRTSHLNCLDTAIKINQLGRRTKRIRHTALWKHFFFWNYTFLDSISFSVGLIFICLSENVVGVLLYLDRRYKLIPTHHLFSKILKRKNKLTLELFDVTVK